MADGKHTPKDNANVTALCLVQRGLLLIEILYWGIRVSTFLSHDLDLDQIILIYELDPYSVEMYTAFANMNFMPEGFRKLSSDMHAFIHTR